MTTKMMTELELQLSDWGAKLYARQVMSRARISEDRRQQEIDRRAQEFWNEIGRSQVNVLNWPGRE